ncbi:MAG: hypothetical protein ACJ71T_08660 [Actinomycetales bacterium]
MPGSLVSRVFSLLRHGVLVALAVPTAVFALAPAPVTSASPDHAAVRSADSSPALATGSSLRSPADALPGPIPVRFGAVTRTPKASWIPADGQVNALATDGTYVYLGGTFTSLTNPANGQLQTHAGLARINLATGVADSTWNPAVVGQVDALAYRSSGGTLFVGGLFSAVNGATRANLAAVSISGGGALSSFNPAPDDEVRALLLDGTKLVVGGLFTTIAGDSQHRLARLDATSGANDSGFTPNVSGGGVFAVVRPPGSSAYAIGGGFTLINNVGHTFIGQVSASSGTGLSWAPSTVCPPGVKCQALSLDANGTTLFAAIAGPGGQTAAYDLASGQRQWVVASDGNSQAVALYGGELYVGGHFNVSFGGQLRRTLAAVDPRTGALDPGFRPSAQSTFPGTEALLATPFGLVAGGAQLAIDGTAQSRLAIFPRSGASGPAQNVPAGPGPGLAVRRPLSSMR